MHTQDKKNPHTVEVMETFGQRIRRLRQDKGMSQVEAAAALPSIDRSYLSKIENDKKIPSWEIFCALADLYDVNTDYLRYGEFSPNQTPSCQTVSDPDEIKLLNAWRGMNDSDRKLFLSFAEKFEAIPSK